MKPYPYLVLLLVFIYSCQKSVVDNNGADTTVQPPFPLQSIKQQPAGCPVLPLYGDTLLFPQPATGEDSVLPVNSPGPGKYFAWPAGLTINQNSGAIDLTKSQAGMRYAIGFVPAGTKDTCISTLIIAGAAYYDSVYVLGDNDTLAVPYFNANAALVNICSTPGACSFDYDGQAAAKGVIVDPATGVIQLSATLNGNGKGQLKALFGSVPKNGSTAVVNINYKLNDGSNDAPQQIAVQFEYYDAKSQVAPGQLKQMATNTFNAANDWLISMSASPRPPVIIIVRKH